MNKTEPPQLTVNRFKPLMEYDQVVKGIKIFKMLDQKKSHWQCQVYILDGICKQGLLVTDTDGKKTLLDMTPDLHVMI
jgi:hypothetical protein